jgi:hypothetical protein
LGYGFKPAAKVRAILGMCRAYSGRVADSLPVARLRLKLNLGVGSGKEPGLGGANRVTVGLRELDQAGCTQGKEGEEEVRWLEN